MRRAISIALLITALAWCAPAAAATWAATGDSAFSGTLAKGDDACLELPWEIIWQQPVADIRSLSCRLVSASCRSCRRRVPLCGSIVRPTVPNSRPGTRR